jgi:CheY-like chemotaxis protein
MIAVTGYGQPSDRQKATDAGFNHFFLKPYKAGDILALLKPQSPSQKTET